jgi:hypothetical protein
MPMKPAPTKATERALPQAAMIAFASASERRVNTFARSKPGSGSARGSAPVAISSAS